MPLNLALNTTAFDDLPTSFDDIAACVMHLHAVMCDDDDAAILNVTLTFDPVDSLTCINLIHLDNPDLPVIVYHHYPA